MKRTFFLMILAFISLNLFAQSKYNDYSVTDKQPVFSEPFDNNARAWITENDWISCKIAEGIYSMRCKNYKSQAGISFKSMKFDDTKDYEIETKMKFIKGNASFLFAMADNYDHFRIEISDNKRLIISKNIISRDKTEKLLTKSVSDIIKNDDFNKLTIRRVSKKMYIFINQEFITEMPEIRFFGSNMGYSVDLESETKIDYLSVSYIYKKEVTTIVTNVLPLLTITSLVFTDQNFNNFIDANEKCNISFSITNKGKGVARDVKVKIFNNVPITGLVYTELVKVGNISPDSSYKVVIPLEGKLDLMTSKADFDITFDEASGFIPVPMKIQIETRKFEAPLLKVNEYRFTTTSGKIEKNYQIDLEIMLQNSGNGNAENVTVDFIVPTKNVFNNVENHIEIPFLAAQQSKKLKFQFTANQLYANPTIPIEIKINEKYSKYAESKTVEATLNTTVITTVVNVEGIKNTPIVDNTGGSLTSDVDKDIPLNATINDKTFAVIIANENYKREVKVQFAINDGKVFYDYCRNTLGIPEKNIHYAQDASFGGMKSEIKWISDVMAAYNGQAKVIFYYAGHGMPNEADKSAYLLPTDGFSADFETAIKLDDLYNRLTTSPAQSVTVFLDACFSGALRDNDGMLANARTVKIKPKTNNIKGNMLIFSAASGEETAYPYKDKQHGLFTYFLLKKLKETAGDVNYQDLSTYIIEKVKQQSVVVNGKSQTPQVIPSAQLSNSWESWKLK